jgi:hypothetical protein
MAEIVPAGRMPEPSGFKTDYVIWIAGIAAIIAIPVFAYTYGYRKRMQEEANYEVSVDTIIFKEPLHLRYIMDPEIVYYGRD